MRPTLCPPPLQFMGHLKRTEAVSEFAKSKSITEQRRFLPAYGVREEMLQVIRENQVGGGGGGKEESSPSGRGAATDPGTVDPGHADVAGCPTGLWDPASGPSCCPPPPPPPLSHPPTQPLPPPRRSWWWWARLAAARPHR